MLDSFVVKYLYEFNEFMGKIVPLVEQLLAIEIPEDYQVFEKAEQRYIVINELKEYEDTNVIFYILMLGFIAFFLIWENRSRYILTCVPFLMIAQLKGIEIVTKYKSRKEEVS